MNKLLLFTLIMILVLPAKGQQSIDMADILDEWVNSPESNLTYENLTITSDRLRAMVQDSKYKRRPFIWRYLNHIGAIDENNMARINKKITFKNIEMGPLSLENIELDGLVLEKSNIQSMRLDSLLVDTLIINNITVPDGFTIYFSHISDYLYIRATSEASATIAKSAIPRYTLLTNCNFNSFMFNQVWSEDLNEHLSWRKDSVSWGVTDNPYITQNNFKHHPIDQNALEADYHVINLSSNKIDRFNLVRSIIPKHHVRIYSDLDRISIRENTIGAVSLFSRASFSELEIKHNTLTTGLRLDKHLAEVLFEINWPDVDNKLRIGSDTLFYPTAQKVVSNIHHYEALSKAYSSLYNYYKSIGMLSYKNACYIQWKDMQTARFKHIYHSQGGLENYFKWKLNELVRAYTKYGTSPARAVVVSIYHILAFAVFYFFFPSDWDVASKKNLVRDYRDFIQKNDKGYIKPFFYLLGGFTVSLINALTLSLNSFITLGFGAIPTRGLARYVCILQGFIGWFLLSIFTVALINQVLG